MVEIHVYPEEICPLICVFDTASLQYIESTLHLLANL
jgi:hypothetical protein